MDLSGLGSDIEPTTLTPVSTTRLTSQRRLAVIIALMLASTTVRAEEERTAERPCATVMAPMPMNVPMQWDIPQSPIDDAIAQFACITAIGIGAEYNVPDCSDKLVGPIKGLMTPIEALSAIMEPVCGIVEVLGETALRTYPFDEPRFDFNIGIMPRLQAMREVGSQAGLVAGYLESNSGQARQLVGPIIGHLSIREALNIIIRGSDLRVRWHGPKRVFFEPLRGKGSCLCPNSQKRILPPSEHVTVIRSRLPALAEFMQAPVIVMDRERIRDIGVSSLPDLLRYMSQSAFTRPRGYRVSGAQYAELRGLGAKYTKVLINGKPADGNASDLLENAFNLNSIPIGAVERIEISADSPSLIHGTDAIGGTVNIVLRRTIDAPSIDVRYGTADGGAAERIGTISAGTSNDRSTTAFVLDVFEADELLGSERARWRNQDFRRFGATDQRSLLATPPNIRSPDGHNLPGLNSSFAAVRPGAAGAAELVPNVANRTSLRAYQAITPAMKRVTLSAIGERSVGHRTTLRGEALLVESDTTYQYGPAFFSGIVLGANHPQNPFGIDVLVDAALSGLPPQQQRVESGLTRGVLELEGGVGDWTYSTFALHTEQRAKSTQQNFVDSLRLIQALSGANEEPLDILSLNPGEGADATILRPDRVNRYFSGSTQVTATVKGAVFELPTGAAITNLGIQARDEFVRFDDRVGRVDRDIGSVFGRLTIPAIDSVELSMGARRDYYSGVDAITRMQYGIQWQPASTVEFHAAHSQSFLPPALYDLHLPRLTFPIQIFDPQRDEIAAATLITGGNEHLRPTTGASTSVGVAFKSEDSAWRASVNLWDIRMRGRVSIPLAPTLLLNEDAGGSGRIVRDSPNTADEQAQRPGRLASIDISHANFGETTTRGMDLSVQHVLATSTGTLQSRIDVTHTHQFRYRDMPAHDALMRERVGIASEWGTITPWRAVGCLAYEGYGWRTNLCGRYHSPYADYDGELGARTGREIPSRTLWDMNISRSITKHLMLTIGASDLLNENIPFSEVNSDIGYDISQADLVQRTLFLKLSGTL